MSRKCQLGMFKVHCLILSGLHCDDRMDGTVDLQRHMQSVAPTSILKLWVRFMSLVGALHKTVCDKDCVSCGSWYV